MTLIRRVIPIAVLLFFILGSVIAYKVITEDQTTQTIKIGLLQSKTGTMALSEKPLIKACQLAIDEINQRGGVIGKKIEPIFLDGASDPAIFAQHAETLIKKHHVQAIFGCWTSSSRKAVKPIVEEHKNILFYPTQYEGMESSKNIIYLGAAPNQQLIPALRWCMDHLGKSFYLIGSDYVFPRTANKILRDRIEAFGGTVAGESYIPLGGTNVEKHIEAILDTKPEVILNTINGDTNLAFFAALSEQWKTQTKIPTMSFSIGEVALQNPGLAEHYLGDYTCWNYFQSIDSPVNHNFVNKLKKQYGKSQVVSDPMEALYFGVHLWAMAVDKGKSADPQAVLSNILNLSYLAPEGMVNIDPNNNHSWKTVRVGKAMKNGQFNILWSSEKPIPPKPYLYLDSFPNSNHRSRDHLPL